MIYKMEKRKCKGCGVFFTVVPWMPWRVEGWCLECAPERLKNKRKDIPAPSRGKPR